MFWNRRERFRRDADRWGAEDVPRLSKGTWGLCNGSGKENSCFSAKTMSARLARKTFVALRRAASCTESSRSRREESKPVNRGPTVQNRPPLEGWKRLSKIFVHLENSSFMLTTWGSHGNGAQKFYRFHYCNGDVVQKEGEALYSTSSFTRQNYCLGFGGWNRETVFR